VAVQSLHTIYGWLLVEGGRQYKVTVRNATGAAKTGLISIRECPAPPNAFLDRRQMFMKQPPCLRLPTLASCTFNECVVAKSRRCFMAKAAATSEAIAG